MVNIGNDVRDLLTRKKTKSIFILIIILFISGPILGALLTRVPVNVVTSQVVSGGSSSDVTQAYAFPFSVFYEQTCTIEFTARYNSTSLRLIIVGQGEFNTGIATSEDPDNLAWRNFMLSTFSRAVAPGSSYSIVTSVLCNGDDSYYVEFMGDGTTSGTDRIWSEPGQYVIVVYVSTGSDAGVFDLKVYLEGPGEFLNGLFFVAGLIMLLGIGVVVGAILIRRFLEV